MCSALDSAFLNSADTSVSLGSDSERKSSSFFRVSFTEGFLPRVDLVGLGIGETCSAGLLAILVERRMGEALAAGLSITV